MAAAQLCPPPVFSAFTATGAPLVGGQLFSYAAGTTTPQATYVDSTLTTPNTNPVILNSLGQANVWLNPSLGYKFVLQDSAGNQQYTVDNVQGALTAPNVVLGPGATGVTLRVNGAADGATALVVVGTTGAQPAVAIGNGNVAGQSRGLLISAGTNTSDFALSVTNAALTALFQINGAGQVSYAGVKQPVFAVALAGFGAPTGAVTVANFPGATATLVQCSNTIARILTTLIAAGIYAA